MLETLDALKQQATDMSIPLAPASADNMLELKAQESIVRGQVGWSQQSSESSRPLTISGAYDPADFTDCRGFHRALHRGSLGNMYFEVFCMSVYSSSLILISELAFWFKEACL